jgi:hypothetical protein
MKNKNLISGILVFLVVLIFLMSSVSSNLTIEDKCVYDGVCLEECLGTGDLDCECFDPESEECSEAVEQEEIIKRNFEGSSFDVYEENSIKSWNWLYLGLGIGVGALVLIILFLALRKKKIF